MEYWLRSAKRSIYNHEKAFEELGIIDWRQHNNKYAINDIVFIYTSKPISKIEYKCIVIGIDISKSDKIDDSTYWVQKNEEENYHGSYVRLKLSAKILSDEFTFEKLTSNGLKGTPQGVRRIRGELLQYILSTIEKFTFEDDDNKGIKISDKEETIYNGPVNHISTYEFRKITARELEYINLKEKNIDTFEKYKQFVANDTNKRGMSVKGNSSAHHSYSRYIIYLLMIIKETKKFEFELDSLEFYNELNLLLEDINFNEYNESEGRFPRATILKFQQFWDLDNLLKDSSELLSSDDIKESDFVEIYSEHSPREKRNPSSILVTGHIRNDKERKKALVMANYCCQVDSNHELFVNQSNNLPYVEAHHLIPLSHQGDFKYSIDVSANIASLCANCHRKIHYGTIEVKSEIIDILYKQHIVQLDACGISISKSDLEKLYGIE